MKRVDGASLNDLCYITERLRADEYDQLSKFGVTTVPRAIAYLAQGFLGKRWTYYDDLGTPFLCGGFIPQRSGVYSTWFLASTAGWDRNAADVTEAGRERCQFMLDSGAHRLETVCLADRERAHRWYTIIGLRRESTLKAYCIDGSDAAMFVMTRGDA